MKHSSVAPGSEEETDDSKTEIDEVNSEEDEPRRAKKPKKGGLVIRLTPLAKKGKGKKKASVTQECSQLLVRNLMSIGIKYICEPYL